MFFDISPADVLVDFSKFDTINIKNLFYNGKSLYFIPYIINWNAFENNYKSYMNYKFYYKNMREIDNEKKKKNLIKRN